MPRKTRMYLAGVPAHIVQRGHNRQPCFYSDDDYLYYKNVLGEGLKRYGGQLHAYCLMTNHVHLLITPVREESISRIVQHVGRQYVQYVNKTYRRSGTLWEGRHKGSLIDAESYLLKCYRYIELNPVSADMVKTPDEYRWSSYRVNAWGEPDALVTPHDLYRNTGLDAEDNQRSYRDLFKVSIPDADLHTIRDAVNKNYPTGNDRFRHQIESMLDRKIGTGRRGRPKRELCKN